MRAHFPEQRLVIEPTFVSQPIIDHMVTTLHIDFSRKSRRRTFHVSNLPETFAFLLVPAEQEETGGYFPQFLIFISVNRRKIFKEVIRTETLSSLNVVSIFSNLQWRGESSFRRFFTCPIVAYYLSSAVFKRDRP